MLFNSPEFLLIFLPITFIGFSFLAFYSSSAVTLWLAFASIVFYAYWSIDDVPILLISIFLNYTFANIIIKTTVRNVAGGLLVLAICLNLSMLGYFKYAQMAIEAVSLLGFNIDARKVMLPIGISFYTFTQIAFLVDAYRGMVHEISLIKYVLFVTYFPHLIAGPILHHKEMIQQFQAYSLKSEKIAVGLTFFFIGLFKKVVLADSAAVWAQPVFAAPDVSAFEAWAAALMYAFQIYFDFSGYCDMAIGISYCFGIVLPLNFNSPYKATSIVDFWRRWHITLSRFLKDYLYVPLGGNRCGSMRRYINLFATMIIGGLWHGAGWNFIVWGALHGTFLIINHVWINISIKLGVSSNATWRSVLGGPLTFASVVIAWVFFKAETIDQAIRLLKSMFFANGILPSGWLDRVLSVLHAPQNLLFQPWLQGSLLLLLLGSVCWLLPNTQIYMRRHFAAINCSGHLFWTASLPNALLIALLAVTSFVLMGGYSPFLYFQF